MTSPSVTIGIPVFNEARFLKATLESAMLQKTHLLVYDNASTDGSDQIIQEMIHSHPSAHYVRQEYNKGGFENMRALLEACPTPYFMWLGGHDVLSSNYISVLEKILDENPEATLAYAPVFYRDEQDEPQSSYDRWPQDQLKDPDPLERVFALIERLEDCSLLHGLFRTDALRRSWFGDPCLGFDHVLLCRVIAQGPFIFTPNTSYARRHIAAHHPQFESDQEQLNRIQGERPMSVSVDDRSRMRDGQWDVLKKVNTSHWARKAWYLWRGRKILHRRFTNDTYTQKETV
jgi:glycosyltransferase involved in cell wall biosynthesis